MNSKEQQDLRAIADTYFASVPAQSKEQVEAMYQAFKARLILEVEIDGGANMGSIWGRLRSRS